MTTQNQALPDSESTKNEAIRQNVLLVVGPTCEKINEIFAHYVGPIASILHEKCFTRWLSEGQLGKRAVSRHVALLVEHKQLIFQFLIGEAGRYIALLAEYIPVAEQRATFVQEARASAVKTLNSNKSIKDVASRLSGTIDLDI